MTIGDVASSLQLSVKSVRRFVASGELPSEKVGSMYRISQKDFNEFVEARKYKASIQPQLKENNLFGEEYVISDK